MHDSLIDITLAALNDAKALDIVVLDVTGQTTISDYMIIASGRSNRQVNAIADRVIASAKENNIALLGVEGKATGEWVLIDIGDVIVHIMHPESRSYYQIEKLWDTKIKQSNAN